MAEATLNERVAALETDTVHIHEEIKDLKEQNAAIMKIATAVEVMAHDIQSVKETVSEVKSGQEELGNKLDAETDRVKAEQEEIHNRITELDNRPAQNTHQWVRDLGSKVAWLVGGAFAAWILYQVFPFLK